MSQRLFTRRRARTFIFFYLPLGLATSSALSRAGVAQIPRKVASNGFHRGRSRARPGTAGQSADTSATRENNRHCRLLAQRAEILFLIASGSSNRQTMSAMSA
jgi:hypothetical protein